MGDNRSSLFPPFILLWSISEELHFVWKTYETSVKKLTLFYGSALKGLFSFSCEDAIFKSNAIQHDWKKKRFLWH